MSDEPKDGKPLTLLDVLIALGSMAPPVAFQPEVTLMHWSVRRTLFLGRLEDFLLGRLADEGIGRKSSPIRVFDGKTATAVTLSGRVYKLEGEPGEDEWARNWWKSVFGNQACEEVTAEYLAKIRAVSN